MNDPDHVVDSSYSLSAFWPGVQFLLGDYVGGKASVMRFLYAWDAFGYIPEYFSIMQAKAHKGGEEWEKGGRVKCSYPLRPELIESMMYHDEVFRNGEMVHWGRMILKQLKNTMTKAGAGGRCES